MREAVVRSQAQRLPGVGESLLRLVFDIIEQKAQALMRVHVAGVELQRPLVLDDRVIHVTA